ncbi:MAG: hypothetical protein ABSH47_02690 [Bryobacteraceae bacterium]|jgi:hypothetical protein
MDTSLLETSLSAAASRLQRTAGDEIPTRELIQELHVCEQELVAKRFVRQRDQFGSIRMLRIPGIESALIHVSQALTDLKDRSVEDARSNIKDAIEDLASVATA